MREIWSRYTRDPILLGRLWRVPIRLEVVTLIWIGALTVFGGPWLAPVLFTSVLFHELAHVAAARRFGYEPVDIVLWPLGGMARFRRFPENEPRQEFWIAVVGPLSSLGLAVAVSPLAWLAYQHLPFVIAKPFVAAVAMNLLLGVFNLLPVFPMDGGRVLRSVLVRRYGRGRGGALTRTVALWSSAVLAFVFLGNGLVMAGVIMALFFLVNLSTDEARPG